MFFWSLSPFDRGVVASLFPFGHFFIFSLVVDAVFCFFLFSRKPFVFPELGLRCRANVFSAIVAVTLLLLLLLVYPALWGLANYLLVIKAAVNRMFFSYVLSMPVAADPFRLYNLYRGVNGLVLYSMGFIASSTDIVDRIFWIVSIRYFYLLPATERLSLVRFLRFPVAVAPAVYLVEVFQLAGSPLTYVVSATVYCVVIPTLIFEAVALGTSTTFRSGDRKVRVSQFDVIRRLITWDLLRDAGLEDALYFADFRETFRVWTGVVAFKTGEGDASLMVVPSLHPGPLLSFCGSLLSYKISEALGKDYELVMVPHSPSTHDFNPSSASEIYKIVEAVRGFLRGEGVEFYEFASPIFSEESFGSIGRVRVFCQAFSNGVDQKVLVFCDLSDENNGDISYGVGNYLIEVAKNVGAKDAIIVDKHFYPHREERPLYMEDPLIGELKALVERAVVGALQSRKERFSFVGFKITRREIESECEELARAIGRDGISVYVLELEESKEKCAYVLLDANTVEPKLGGKILKLFLRRGFKENNIIIMTSDTHQDLLFLKPFGSKGEIHEPTIKIIEKLLGQLSKPRKVMVSLNRILSEVDVWGLLNGERFFTVLLKAFPRTLSALLLYWLVAFILSLLTL
ncbi:MAG: DUF2070 family protein [Candidatus Freyarchaeota archaeon]|nr:DUF2070 family protein [Candidatus Jordarchaeia archaeon]MBS7280053.1 DUF2070 family protein [Candidatus Jordarchaeia archaeon]